jgi:hypothetical protein
MKAVDEVVQSLGEPERHEPWPVHNPCRHKDFVCIDLGNVSVRAKKNLQVSVLGKKEAKVFFVQIEHPWQAGFSGHAKAPAGPGEVLEAVLVCGGSYRKHDVTLRPYNGCVQLLVYSGHGFFVAL